MNRRPSTHAIAFCALVLAACASSPKAAPKHPTAEGAYPAPAPGTDGGRLKIPSAPSPESSEAQESGSEFLVIPTEAESKFDSENFGRTIEAITMGHVGNAVPFDDLLYGMVKGMVDALGDEHSHYLDPAEAKMFLENRNERALAGIGATLGIKDGRVIVIATTPGSPAAKAGMKQGDVIVEVDGVEAVDQPLEKVVPRIRGDEGTKVRIQIFRSGEKKPRDLELTRAKITPPPALTSKIVTSGKKRVMVIAISEFMNGVSEAFHAAAIEALEKRVDGIVLDLRNDPGGSLNIAEDIICHWEREAPVVIMEYKGPLAIPRHCEPGAAILKGMPTSVLVNRYSASASEIVSGALQDNGVARVIGEKTYGKGCGQSVVQYPDGSILIITTFHWKTPKGRAIHKVGLEPDEKVEMDPSDVGEPDKKDPQMDRAVQFLSTGK